MGQLANYLLPRTQVNGRSGGRFTSVTPVLRQGVGTAGFLEPTHHPAQRNWGVPPSVGDPISKTKVGNKGKPSDINPWTPCCVYTPPPHTHTHSLKVSIGVT